MAVGASAAATAAVAHPLRAAAVAADYFATRILPRRPPSTGGDAAAAQLATNHGGGHGRGRIGSDGGHRVRPRRGVRAPAGGGGDHFRRRPGWRAAHPRLSCVARAHRGGEAGRSCSGGCGGSVGGGRGGRSGGGGGGCQIGGGVFAVAAARAQRAARPCGVARRGCAPPRRRGQRIRCCTRGRRPGRPPPPPPPPGRCCRGTPALGTRRLSLRPCHPGNGRHWPVRGLRQGSHDEGRRSGRCWARCLPRCKGKPTLATVFHAQGGRQVGCRPRVSLYGLVEQTSAARSKPPVLR